MRYVVKKGIQICGHHRSWNMWPRKILRNLVVTSHEVSVHDRSWAMWSSQGLRYVARIVPEI